MALYITFILYFCIIFFIGYRAFKATDSHEDFVLGGRKLNSIITALGVGASDMSGWLMIALPGAIYTFGYSHVWMPIGLLIGAFLNWHFVAYRLRVFTFEAENSITIPSYLEHRFKDDSKVLRLLTAVVVIVFFTVYASSSFVSSGGLFSALLGMDYHVALVTGATVLVLYTAFGGFLAVNWVDVFQGGLMLLALIILPIYIYFLISGTDPNLLSESYLKDQYSQQFTPGYFDFIPRGDRFTVFISLASTLTWGLGYFGQLHILVRFMASESKKSINQAKKICMSWMFISLLGAILVGYMGKIFYLNGNLANPEHVFFHLVQDNMNEWISGWFIAAVLSCIMSTIAAQLILLSSALAEDIYRTKINPNASNKNLLWVGRTTVILVAIVALALAWDNNSTVMELVAHAWAGLGASFGPVILLSLFWSRMTKQGAFWGILIGSTTVVLWIFARHLWSGAEGGWASILQLYEMMPAFVANLVTIVTVSLLDKPDPEVIKLYNRAHKKCI
ncbi:MAG: sodium/proline symporter PutP [Gammaproteobacteria bacterium]|nr:sodium/proline symporter PutP [Gammaproteobacteria bacterium]